MYERRDEWVGMRKRRRRQALEHDDARGMPMKISHEVYINSIKIRLPASLSTLSAADLATIAANHGSPYTEVYTHLFTFLRVSVSPLPQICYHPDVLCGFRTHPLLCALWCGVVLQPIVVHDSLVEFSPDEVLSVHQSAIKPRQSF